MFNLGGVGDMMKNFSKVQKLMKDDNFKTFLNHPEVQELLKDGEFQQAAKSKNIANLMTNQKLMKVMQDPAVQKALSSLDVNELK